MTTRARTILTNTGFNLVGMVLTSLIALVVTPILIKNLGSEMFGVWALCGVVIVLSQMLDFGLGRALVRQVAQGRALGRWSHIAAHLNSAIWPLLGLALALTLAGLGLAPWLARLLGIPEPLLAVSVTTLRILTLSFIPTVCTMLMGASLEGAQRMAYTSAGVTVNRLVFALGALLAVWQVRGLVGIAQAHLLGALLQMAVLFLAAIRVTPGLRVSPRLVKSDCLAADWRFGRYVFASSVVALCFTATNKIALARWSGLASVAFYELAALVAGQIFLLALALAQAVYPAFAAAYVEAGMDGVRRLYLGSLRLAVLVIVPLAGAVIALAAPFVTAWFGRYLAEPVAALQALSGAWAVVSLAASASMALQAMARPGLAWLLTLYNMALNFILVLVLAPRWGYWGLIAANVIAISSSGFLTLAVFGRVSDVDRRAFAVALSPGVVIWAMLLAVGLAWVGERIAQPDLLHLLLLGGVYTLIYGVGLIVLGLLRPEESAWLRRWLRPSSLFQGMAP